VDFHVGPLAGSESLLFPLLGNPRVCSSRAFFSLHPRGRDCSSRGRVSFLAARVVFVRRRIFSRSRRVKSIPLFLLLFADGQGPRRAGRPFPRTREPFAPEVADVPLSRPKGIETREFSISLRRGASFRTTLARQPIIALPPFAVVFKPLRKFCRFICPHAN